MPNAIADLRQAVEVVRAQIPKGELTLASVQRLLEAAEAVCQHQEQPAEAPVRSPRQPARQSIKRQEERRKWARIAKEAEREAHAPPVAAE